MEEEIKTTEAPETSAKTFTQEEVNSMIKERLDRAEKKWQEKYSNYYSADDLAGKTEEYQKQIAELGNSLTDATDKATADAQTIAELQEKVRKHETDSEKIRIALQNGIPYELADKLAGTTKEEIEEDARKFSQFISKPATMPTRNINSTEVDGVTAAFRALNPNIKV